eukprot:SM000120S25678  [mRNA]  locus=s120:59327:62188:+ [translate_table: standard]
MASGAVGDDGCFTLRTGARIPAVGLGTWQATDGQGKTAVAAALECGYRHLDCAHLYGNEREVGEALAEALRPQGGGDGGAGLRREDVFVSSKLWCTSTAHKHVLQACERSLNSLGLEYLDLYLVHWPVTSPVGDLTDPPRKPPPLEGSKSNLNMQASIWPSVALQQPLGAASQWAPTTRVLTSEGCAGWWHQATWLAMENLVQRALVRAIGTSNFGIPQLEDVLGYATIPPAVNQVELHPYWKQDDLLRFCRQHDIHVSAHTPLGIPGAAGLTVPADERPSPAACSSGGSDTEPQPSPGRSDCTAAARGGSGGSGVHKSRSVHAPMLKDRVILQIAERLGKTPAQVILRWGIQRGTSVLPKSVRPERISSNLRVLDWELSPADFAAVDSLGPQVRLVDGAHSSFLAESLQSSLCEIDEEDEGTAIGDGL